MSRKNSRKIVYLNLLDDLIIMPNYNMFTSVACVTTERYCVIYLLCIKFFFSSTKRTAFKEKHKHLAYKEK